MADTYSFKMGFNTVHATIDGDTFHYKIGVAKQVVPFADMRHLYVIPGSVQQLVIAYEKDGALKRLTSGANSGQAAFEAVVEAIVARRPEIDIRHLPAKEANRLLGRHRTLIAVGAILTVAVALVVMYFVSSTVEGWFE